MRKAGVLCAVVALVALAAFGMAGNAESVYTRNATVDFVQGETVTCSDETGNAWEFRTESVYAIGQEIVLKMHDNHTSGNIYDDVILSAK